MLASGDKRGLKEGTVTSVNRKQCPMLVLLLGNVLPPDANVKHLRVVRRDKLKYHSLGMLRHVTDFKPHAASEDNHRSFAQGKRNMLKKTPQNHLDKLHEKIGDTGIGSGLFHEECNKNDDDNDINDFRKKSFPESVSKISHSYSHLSSKKTLSKTKK